jgi:branched-chain amino acid transport system ATP-binding protein
MLRVENLSVAIGPVTIVRDASLEVCDRAMCGLIGRNGAGKTTLLRGLMGAIAASGKADLDGVDLIELPSHRRLAHGVGYMPEDRRLVPEFTVEDNIRLPSWALAIDAVEKRIEWIFALMPELLDLRDRRALELSGGQQKMVALARALMAGRRILLLDEPFEGLAPALARRLAAVLADLKSEGLSILIAESNQIHVAELLSDAYRIERGQVTRA